MDEKGITGNIGGLLLLGIALILVVGYATLGASRRQYFKNVLRQARYLPARYFV